MPIAWEQVEPVEGKFDFSFLDALVEQAARAEGPPRAALVRDVEEHRKQLCARMGEARHRAVSAHAQGRRHCPLRLEPAWTEHAGGRQTCLRRADAPSGEDRPRPCGDHGPARERSRQLRAGARSCPCGRSTVPWAGADRTRQGVESEAGQLDRNIRQARRAIFPDLAFGALHRRDRRSRQSSEAAADVRQRRAGRCIHR
ncbi:beta-galactosidase [Sphingomonas psychrotolerans]|uniref:beta-galactosidase n=1 Tax=Sphingomonas psychrotolerans TaxID=1327635 RepID=UPI001F23DF4A|nr:beta-galactosidase [Sphingomonas psychrotolerans]